MCHKQKYLFAAIFTVLWVVGCTKPQLISTSQKCDYPSPAFKATEYLENFVINPKLQLKGDSLKAYQAVQEKIETQQEKDDKMIYPYHHAVVAYEDYKTPFSFFLVGIEKPRGEHKRPYCNSNEQTCDFPKFDPGRFKGESSDDQGEIEDTREDIEDRLFNDSKPMVPTHILKAGKTTSDNTNKDQQVCFVFNVYGDDGVTPWCNNSLHPVEIDKPAWSSKAWKALDRLGAEIKATAQRENATHIILLATGWATVEYESFLDFSHWMTSLRNDFAGKEFRPIYIGIAWESGFPALSDTASFTTKGNDADEIGFTWVNYLLNDVLNPIAAETNAQLVAIGHSFGTRIVLGSHYVRDVLMRSTPVLNTPVTLIGIQAAFPTGRFISQEGKEHQYVRANKGDTRVIITSSDSDKATYTICYYDLWDWEIGTGYVGGPCGLEQVKNNPEIYRKSITLLETADTGQPISIPVSNQVSLYDASSFVNCELKGTSSGSHSDVYDNEMGHFLGEIIRSGWN